MQAIAGTLELFDAAHVWMSQIPMDVPIDKLDHIQMYEKLQRFQKEKFVKQSVVLFDIAELYITSKNTIGGSGNCMSLMLHIRLVSQSRHVTCA
jgi:hypothetical protein